MRKMLMLILLAAVCASLARAGSPQRREKTEPTGHAFRIDAIQAWKSDPCRVRLQVKYFIDPATTQSCQIGAYVPSRAAMADFELTPAGKRRGVPKGEQSYSEDVIIDLHYLGLKPFASSSIEVVIFDASGPLCSRTFAWGREWTRFAIQGINPVKVAADYAKILVRYFIDPAYPHACYISGFTRDLNNNGNNDFKNIPAGFNPDGLPKGKKNFADNISFELLYKGVVPYKSSSLDVVIYNPRQNLLWATFPWGQTWKPQAKR
ncbi:MAG: hypothetical protein MUC72_05450 [Acidobacteria bacterium]|nr:hypothetical protein [Acidobacteriota bacterium]